jgi:hypothetical protein
MRRIAVPLIFAGIYAAFWAYAWTGAGFPELSSTAEVWALALLGIVLHVAIGYVIGNPWAIALAAVPALTLMTTDEREWVSLVLVQWGGTIAVCIAGGVLLRRHRERVLRALSERDGRRTGLSLGMACVYVALWAYVWTPGGDDLPTLSTGAATWAFAICAIAAHIAIGYLIGSPWAIALAAAPALTLIPHDATGVLIVVMIAQGVPLAAFLTVGVMLKRLRQGRPFHAL